MRSRMVSILMGAVLLTAMSGGSAGAGAPGVGFHAPVTLRVIDESRAGSPAAASAGAGEAITISTGAEMPGGCDAVVRIEETEHRNDSIAVAARVEPGRDVRRAGDDVRAGDVVLRVGAALGPSELGVLASIGRAGVSCARRPRLAVLRSERNGVVVARIPEEDPRVLSGLWFV